MILKKETETALNDIITKENLNPEKYNKRINDFLSFLPIVSSSSNVLDVGIGTGLFSVLLKLEFGCNVYGIDLYKDNQSQRDLERRYEQWGIDFGFMISPKKNFHILIIILILFYSKKY